MAEERAGALLARLERMKGARRPWESAWQEIAERFRPVRADFDGARRGGPERRPEIFDTTGEQAARGLGRKADALAIDAMDGATNAVGDYTTGLTKTLLLEAFEALNAADVPDDGQRYGLLSPHAWSEALAIPEFASADFVGKDDKNLPFLTATEVRKWLGITWIMHTGLPLANADDRTCFVYHKTAVGLAIGADITTDISWHGDRAAHFVNNWMSMGACLIDAAGVVEIRVDDDTAIG